MDFLHVVGSDALINSFAVNLKSNTSTAVVNELQMIAFNELSGKSITFISNSCICHFTMIRDKYLATINSKLNRSICIHLNSQYNNYFGKKLKFYLINNF